MSCVLGSSEVPADETSVEVNVWSFVFRVLPSLNRSLSPSEVLQVQGPRSVGHDVVVVRDRVTVVGSVCLAGRRPPDSHTDRGHGDRFGVWKIR